MIGDGDLTLVASVKADRQAALAYTGKHLNLSVAQDRIHPACAADQCPTCDEGFLTITHPRRCRQCQKDGL